MSKLHKKCFLASTGAHVLLLLVLLIGPAFLMRSEKMHDMPVLEFIPEILLDAPVQGGGNPEAQVAKPQPQPVTQRAERQPVTVKPEPQPVKADPKPEAKPDPVPKWKPTSVNLDNTKKIRKPDLSAKPVVPRQDSSKVYAQVADDLLKAVSSTSIEMPSLGAGGGPAYADYAQAIKTIYERAWYPPDVTASDEALVKVQVVISKDGSVVSAKIISRCGEASVDGSVDATLRRVTKVPPFPAGAKESTRTYVIGFNLKAKRGLG